MTNTVHSINPLLTITDQCHVGKIPTQQIKPYKLKLTATECPQDLSYKDRHWHEDCFHCFQCKRSLVDKPFSTKDEQLLCTECYSNKYSSKCHECKKTIMPGERTVWEFNNFDLTNTFLFQNIQTLQKNTLTIHSLVQSDK